MALVGTSKRRFSKYGLWIVVLLVVPVFFVVVEADAASTPAVYISDEAFAPTTASSCSGQSASSATGIALRTAVEAQDDIWRAAAAADGVTSFSLLTLPTPTNANEVDTQPTLVSVSGANLIVGVSKRDVSPVARDSLAPNSFGTPDVTNYRDPYTPAWGTSASASTLQECAPRPQWLYDGVALPQPRMWNTVGGDGGTLDASFFEFSRPIDSFGAWFGDVETRTDGEGVPAALKLFDVDGNVLYLGPIPTSTVNQAATCGGTGTLGCGNKGTRWVGFHGLDSEVASMLVVVGDDDSCPAVSTCEGLTEHLSWIGATVGLKPAELVVDKSAPAGPHAVGAQFSYTIAVENIGDAAASSVMMEDTIPDGLDVVSASGIGWTCAVSGQDVNCVHDTDINAATSASGITIVVEVTGDSDLVISNEVEVEYMTGGESLTATDDVSTSREPIADLSIDKSYVIRPDDSIEWTVAVANDGPDAAADVVVVDTLPAGLSVDSVSAPGWTCVETFPSIECDLAASLAAGGSASFTIVTSSTIGSATFENGVVVESSTTDLEAENNQDSESAVLTVTPPSTTGPTPTTAAASSTTTTIVNSGAASSGPDASTQSNSGLRSTADAPSRLALTGRSSSTFVFVALFVMAVGLVMLGVTAKSRRTSL